MRLMKKSIESNSIGYKHMSIAEHLLKQIYSFVSAEPFEREREMFFQTIIFNSLTYFGEQRKLIHYNNLKFSKKSIYAMLFNDFLLLTTVKRPLIRTFWQIIYRQTKSPDDWFDSPSSDHLYLMIYKKVARQMSILCFYCLFILADYVT